jgi:3-hydroxyisobutyrate dehydrogenase
MVKIAFIGLGAMGTPMAANLIKAGHDVRAFDLHSQALEPIKALGARTFARGTDCVQDVDVVVTMLPDDAAVEQFYSGAEGVLSRLLPGTLVIDCSTISVGVSRRIADAAAAAGLRMLDAPVSGGPMGASDATLSFMIGGAADDVAAAEPILQAMGDKVIHVGGNGSGQAAKICNNMLAAIITAASSEALALGVRNGIDPARLTEVFQASSGGNTMLNRWHPWPGVRAEAPSTDGYEGGFQLRLMLKDLGLALSNASDHNAPVPLGALSRSLYLLRATNAPDALSKDFTCIQQMYAENLTNDRNLIEDRVEFQEQ